MREVTLPVVWRSVPGYEGLYEISSRGDIKRVGGGGRRLEETITPKVDAKGCLVVSLYGHGYGRYKNVDSLVAEAFIGPRPRGYKVEHIDGIKTNNESSNIEYVAKPIAKRSFGPKRKRGSDGGERSPSHKLTDFDVEIIRELLRIGWNPCRIARHIGMSGTTIYAIRDGYTWRQK